MARRTANQLLDSLGVTEYPVDPEAIATRLRIEVVDTPGFPPHCYGGLVLSDGQFRIVVSTACPTPELRRFTIAHEVGHASIDEHTQGLEWVDQAGQQVALSEGHFRGTKNPIEIEADHFASELLMPQRWAQHPVDTLPPGIEAIREIARRFNTSLASTAVRYATLSAAPILVVLSKDRTIEWISRSPSVAETAFIRFQPAKDAWAPPGSATRVVADDPEAVSASKQASSAGYLFEWFPRAPKHLTVEVEAIGLGSYGRVLSLLMCPNLPDPDELYLEEEGEDAEDRDWRSALRREAGYGD
jgi:hypothetical protein